ncbi:hypothetical protein EVAR_29064_1 [Eumeta japonica]|uniref:RNA-directed DNA polymerase from mobile element jockey n=1 Tax=Eumeta variegata TaxID=151549 RepID=A0A4C1VPN0_EUMVA|nr:hypothetical protein EVAR_29064_1 [Eumeta japonica]
MARRHERTHSTRRLIRAGVPQGSTLSSAVLRVHKRCTATVVVWRPTRVIRGRYRAFTEVGIGAPDSPSLQRAIDELGQWFRKWRIEVNPDKSAAIQFKDLELPTISKYMKDASKRFFDIAGSHPNAFRAAVDYQPPHPTHLIRRPRNVLTDPPDALTAAVESLNDVNDTHD